MFVFDPKRPHAKYRSAALNSMEFTVWLTCGFSRSLRFVFCARRRRVRNLAGSTRAFFVRVLPDDGFITRAFFVRVLPDDGFITRAPQSGCEDSPGIPLGCQDAWFRYRWLRSLSL